MLSLLAQAFWSPRDFQMLQAVTSKTKACSLLKASDRSPSVRTEHSHSLLCVLFDHMETSGHFWPWPQLSTKPHCGCDINYLTTSMQLHLYLLCWKPATHSPLPTPQPVILSALFQGWLRCHPPLIPLGRSLLFSGLSGAPGFHVTQPCHWFRAGSQPSYQKMAGCD